jgi:hypothetical protein
MILPVKKRMVTARLARDMMILDGSPKISPVCRAVITKNSMAMAEAMLPEESFVRVHRSYIVAKDKISSFTGEVVTIGREEIPIGKLYRAQVIKGLE